MNKVMMRVQCLRVSTHMKTKFAALGRTDPEHIADAMASFAGEEGDDGIAPRMVALEIAVDDADRRSGLADIVNHARTIMTFADPPPPPEPVKVQPRRKSKGRKKTSTSR